MSVTISKAVRQSLTAMQSTAKMMAETQNRLATGKKVNSALDNPTNFFTASALDSRAGDLSNLMDNVGNAVKTLEAADNGIKAIQKLVESAQGTAKQALQAANTVTNATVEGTVANYVVATGGGSLDIDVGNGDVNIALAATDTLAQSVTKINAAAVGFTATATDDGKLSIVADKDDATITITDGGGTANLATGFGLSTSATSATNTTPSATRETLEAQFKETLTQIDQLTKDAGFNGNNFLNGDSLKVTFNENGSSSMTIKGVDASSSGLGLSDPAASDFQSNEKLEAVLTSLDTAMTSLRSSASSFGSNLSTVQTRQDFTESMINT
ncbi:MAG: hypothetical protein HRU28_04255, partial [Rhizobiales bacterium]|nr:hypothetical protein [Hyphomicrobiales bacterium]